MKKIVFLLWCLAMPCLGADHKRAINGRVYDFSAHYAWLQERATVSIGLSRGPGQLRKDYQRRKMINDQQWPHYSRFLVEGNWSESRLEGMIISRRTRPPGSK